jgi:hypothetical protein
MDPLSAVFGSITQVEQSLVPVFIHNRRVRKSRASFSWGSRSRSACCNSYTPRWRRRSRNRPRPRPR